MLADVRTVFFKFFLVFCVVVGASAGYAQDQQDRMPQQAAVPTSAVACQIHAYSILVTIHDVRHSGGTITADLHGDDPEKFLGKGQKLDRIRVPATEDQTQMCIPVENPGVYAIALYHDEDGDTKFDKNFIGLPSEPFGLSNDPRIRLAKPKHSESAFEVKGPATPVTVTLKH